MREPNPENFSSASLNNLIYHNQKEVTDHKKDFVYNSIDRTLDRDNIFNTNFDFYLKQDESKAKSQDLRYHIPKDSSIYSSSKNIINSYNNSHHHDNK